MVRNSSPALLLFVALAGAAVGLGLGLLLGGDDGPAVHAAERDDDARAASVPDDARPAFGEEGLVRPLDGPVERGGEGAATSATGVRQATMDRAVRRTAAPSVEIESGTGVLRGVTTGRDGQPVPGVTVVLTPPQSRETRGKSSDSLRPGERTLTLEETLEREAARWAKKEGASRSVVSGEDGTFVIEGLPEERTFRIKAEAEGWRFRADGPSLVAPGDRVTMIGRPTSVFTLRLTTTTGVPVTEALVNLSGRWYEWSADDPLVSVTRRQVRVSAIAEPFEPHEVGESLVGRWASVEVPVDVAPDGSTVVDLELEPNCIVAGRVEGPRHGNSGVFALPLRPGERFDPTVKVQNARTGGGYSGLYLITGLLPGRHAIGIRDDETSMPISHEIVELVDGLNRVDLVKGEIDRSRCVSVLALGPDGTRLDSVNYGFEWTRDGGERDTEGVRTFDDVEGRDLVSLDNFYSFDIDDWPSGTKMWLYGTCTGYGKVSVPFQIGMAEATLQFEPPCELSVSIDGDYQAGGYSIVVYDASQDTEDPSRLATARQTGRGTRISRSGTVRFRGLAPGPVTVRLERAVRWWGRGLEIDSAAVTLTGRDHQVSLTAATLTDLSVVVTPYEKDRDLSLIVLDETADDGERYVSWAECSEAGRATFRMLPAGEYVLIDRRSGARLDVTLPSPQVTWDLSDYQMEVTVSVSKRDGMLGQWGFQGGDVVTLLDGEALEDDDAILDRLAESSATVTVRRGEQTLELKLPRYPRSERKANPLGGRFFLDG